MCLPREQRHLGLENRIYLFLLSYLYVCIPLSMTCLVESRYVGGVSRVLTCLYVGLVTCTCMSAFVISDDFLEYLAKGKD